MYWETKVTASASSSTQHATHRGGGVSAGVGLAFDVFRQLSVGVSVDHFRGSPMNIGTLYSGTIEWRFGPR